MSKFSLHFLPYSGGKDFGGSEKETPSPPLFLTLFPSKPNHGKLIISTPFPFLSFHTQHIFSSGFFTLQHFFVRKRYKLYWKTWPCRLFYFYQTRLSLCYDFLLLSTWLIWWLIRQARFKLYCSSQVSEITWSFFSIDPLMLLLKE